jgi:putative ABC transport system permease protein
MSRLTRFLNVFRKRKMRAEIDEELADHIRHAVAEGRSREEAERALGSVLHLRENSSDVRLWSWLDSLRSDVIFGLRQLGRRRTATAAAIISLALAIGSVTAAFRLIDAALLRPLPVKDPHSLFVVAYSFLDDATGRTDESYSFSYPMFRDFRDAIKEKAEIMAVSGTRKADLTFSGDQEIEKAYSQYVSGAYFGQLGIQPALGRLLSPADDINPGGHPVAVLSFDYWEQRFARDPKVIGRTFRQGVKLYEIVGVAQQGFTGTETGKVVSFFLPTMESAEAVNQPNWHWVRIWVRPKSGTGLEEVRQPLQSVLSVRRKEMVKRWPPNTPQSQIDRYVNAPVLLQSAAAGQSYTQKQYRQPLYIIGLVVLLVLLIACANVANLLTAQAGARSKEMALRVSIGAGRGRLIQLMLLECLLLAAAASALGGLFSWWSAPFVVGMINPPDDPVRLSMPADWRVLGFSAALALGVTILFGLMPALRASAVDPVASLKGGDNPHSRRRMMNALIAVQVAFCFVVHFGAGLFVATLDRLTSQSPGFEVDRILLLETGVKGAGKDAHRPAAVWHEIATRLGEFPGVESSGLSSWALMSGNESSNTVHFPNRTKDETQAPMFLSVSANWIKTMRIDLIDGRDFNQFDRQAALDDQKNPVAGSVIVNQAFARKYFNSENPIGKSFGTFDGGKVVTNTIIGYVKDAHYRDFRETIRPTFYAPFHGAPGATLAVRVASGIDPLSLAQPLRQLVSEVRPDFRVSNVRTQSELVHNQTIRERLLATLSSFFAAVALILAGVGLYGVMHYAVLTRRREMGIRIALGAGLVHIAKQICGDVLVMLLAGSALGLTGGLLSERYIETLLFDVKGTDWAMLAVPILMLGTAALVAAVPPILNASKTDPVTSLRADA